MNEMIVALKKTNFLDQGLITLRMRISIVANKSYGVILMAQTNRVTAPELEQFVVIDVQLTGTTLGAGAYGSVEEAEIHGARVAAKKIHSQLINLGSPQQVS